LALLVFWEPFDFVLEPEVILDAALGILKMKEKNCQKIISRPQVRIFLAWIKKGEYLKVVDGGNVG
jgi:hypothetical protein